LNRVAHNKANSDIIKVGKSLFDRWVQRSSCASAGDQPFLSIEEQFYVTANIGITFHNTPPTSPA